MSASAAFSGIDTNPGKVADMGVSVQLDNAFARLAGDPKGSAFDGRTISSAEAITAQHVAAGNLPNVEIRQALDITQAPIDGLRFF